jgi:hypothetical protein
MIPEHDTKWAKKALKAYGKYEGLISFTITVVIALVLWAIIFRPDWHLICDFIFCRVGGMV